jgi:Flp pilus assembly protein TadD
MTALAAILLSLATLPAQAADSVKKPTPAAEPAATGGAQRNKATPEERLSAMRLDPLAKAAFWAREVDIDPLDAQATVALAGALRGLGQFKDAAQTGSRVLVMDPKNLDALLEVARDYVAGGEGFYAIEPAKSAQMLAPKDWRPVSLLAIAYEQTSRDEEALAAHTQALALSPNEPKVICNLALYYAAHGDLPKAEALLRQATALPNATPQVRQNLALVVGLQGRMDEAESIARRDLPPESVANNLAWLRAAAGQAPAAGIRSWETMRGGG